mgnify:FL=1
MSRRALWTWADYERSARAEEARARAREAEGAQAPVACAAAAHDGLVSGALDVSSLDWAPAVQDPRTVAPAAGPKPPDPCDRPGSGSAAPLSPGLCWAREAMARGVSLAAVLRKGGDQLTWRDRAALQAVP